MAANMLHTISVVDKSGKVVSTSKHLFGVFTKAQNAYRERKAEIRAERSAKIAEKQALRALEACHINDDRSVATSRKSGRSRTESRNHPPRSNYHQSHYEQDLHRQGPYGSNESPMDLERRHTDMEIATRGPRPAAGRYNSDSHIDMDLAYGEVHPSSLALAPRDEPAPNEELNGLVGKAQMLLEEADCVQRSATATMAHLQKNPEAMAAVALTLAEISNIAAKLAPGVLASLKASAPSVFALLASPQFLIAAGLGIGVTIVMFGGYKIIKQIQNPTPSAGAPKGQQAIPEPMDEMFELNEANLSRVEVWRRGVADMEAESVGTSVDGEFITPTAAAMSGIDITLDGMARDPRFKYNGEDDMSTASSHRSKRSHRSRAHSSTRSSEPSRAHSKTHSKASKAPSKAPSKTSSRVSESEKKSKEKAKKPSRLRLMFTA